jgi:molybdopterin converting factor small subunit
VPTVRFFAAARAASGVDEAEHAAASLTELLAGLARCYGDPLRQVLDRSSYLVDGVAWHDRAAPLPPAATVDVLPPFAGG